MEKTKYDFSNLDEESKLEIKQILERNNARNNEINRPSHINNINSTHSDKLGLLLIGGKKKRKTCRKNITLRKTKRKNKRKNKSKTKR